VNFFIADKLLYSEGGHCSMELLWFAKGIHCTRCWL